MIQMDLHPEDLIEREALGEISPAERERLDLHSRQCTVCRVERQAREDFRSEAEGPEAEADVARLLASMATPLAVHMRQRASRRSPMRYLRFVAAAAAVVSVTGFAAAARWSGVRAVIIPWAAPAPVGAVAQVGPVVAPSKTPARPGPVVAPVREDALTTVEAPPSVPAVEAPIGVTAVRAVNAAPVRRAATKVAAPEPVPHSALAVQAPVAETSSDASIAFRQANEARQAGDHPRAGELYGMLLNRFSGSPEAHASLALFGRMLLDDGNANGALQCFDDYLRTGGALREDVMLGRALAFQRIGPRASADEARAWSSLLDAYPGTVHTARARRRLAELQGS